MSVKVMSAIAVEQRWQDKHTKQCLPFLLKIARMKVGTRTTAVKRSGKFSMLRREIYLFPLFPMWDKSLAIYAIVTGVQLCSIEPKSVTCWSKSPQGVSKRIHLKIKRYQAKNPQPQKVSFSLKKQQGSTLDQRSWKRSTPAMSRGMLLHPLCNVKFALAFRLPSKAVQIKTWRV